MGLRGGKVAAAALKITLLPPGSTALVACYDGGTVNLWHRQLRRLLEVKRGRQHGNGGDVELELVNGTKVLIKGGEPDRFRGLAPDYVEVDGIKIPDHIWVSLSRRSN
jgi:hypothetical protein